MRLGIDRQEDVEHVAETLHALKDHPLGGACDVCRKEARRFVGEYIRRQSGFEHPVPAPLDVETLRATFHELRWCKDVGRGHAFAHGDDPEDDEDRARFAETYARLSTEPAQGGTE